MFAATSIHFIFWHQIAWVIAGCGLFLFFRRFNLWRRISSFGYSRLRKHYFLGLNYLINEKPEQALTAFLKVLRTSDESFDIQMGLANLFRRKGEVDRAIRLHTELMSRAKFSSKNKNAAMVELGKDYLAAGVLDRAEDMFKQLFDQGVEPLQCIGFLREIYEKEKNWSHALEITFKLKQYNPKLAAFFLSHYYCEKAEKYIAQAKLQSAKDQLHLAIVENTVCARAYLIHAKMAFAADEYEKSAHYLQRACSIDLDCIADAIAPLFFCYDALSDLAAFLQCVEGWIKRGVSEDHIYAIADFLRRQPKADIIYRPLLDCWEQYPSYLLCCYKLQQALPSATKPALRARLQALEQEMQALLDDRKSYQCRHCGFDGKSHYWLCPSCHYWGSIKVSYH